MHMQVQMYELLADLYWFLLQDKWTIKREWKSL